MNSEFNQEFKEKNNTNLKWKRKDFPIHLQGSIILIPWSDKNSSKKETADHKPHEKSNPEIHKHKEPQSSGVYNVNARVVQNSINVICHITVWRKKIT